MLQNEPRFSHFTSFYLFIFIFLLSPFSSFYFGIFWSHAGAPVPESLEDREHSRPFPMLGFLSILLFFLSLSSSSSFYLVSLFYFFTIEDKGKFLTSLKNLTQERNNPWNGIISYLKENRQKNTNC